MPTRRACLKGLGVLPEGAKTTQETVNKSYKGIDKETKKCYNRF